MVLAFAEDGELKRKLLSLALSFALYIAIVLGLVAAMQDRVIDVPKEIRLAIELQKIKKEEEKKEPQMPLPQVATPQAEPPKKIEPTPQPIKKAETQKAVQKIVKPAQKVSPQESMETHKDTKAAKGTESETKAEPLPASTTPKEATKGYEELNLAQIKEMIVKALKYPAVAKRMKKEGVVLLSFGILHSGVPQNIKIERSSGFQPLDSAAISAIEGAGAFPPPQKEVTITVPIEFNLEEG